MLYGSRAVLHKVSNSVTSDEADEDQLLPPARCSRWRVVNNFEGLRRGSIEQNRADGDVIRPAGGGFVFLLSSIVQSLTNPHSFHLP